MLKHNRSHRTHERSVSKDAMQIFGQNSTSQLQWRRVSVMGSDRIEPGNAHWTPLKIAIVPPFFT